MRISSIKLWYFLIIGFLTACDQHPDADIRVLDFIPVKQRKTLFMTAIRNHCNPSILLSFPVGSIKPEGDG